MKYIDIRLTDRADTPCSLVNITGYGPNGAGVTDIKDAVEDAKDAQDLCERLNKMDLLSKPWKVNRINEERIRLIHKDNLGNVDYLIINLAPQEKINKEELITYIKEQLQKAREDYNKPFQDEFERGCEMGRESAYEDLLAHLGGK